MPGVIENHSIAQWSRLFAVLENLKGKLDKLDDQLQTVREQQSLMMGRLEDIEESLAWEDDGEEELEAPPRVPFLPPAALPGAPAPSKAPTPTPSADRSTTGVARA